MEETTRQRAADRSTSSTRGWRVLDPHAPDAELRARLQSLNSAVTLKVGQPFRLGEAIALQAKVTALIARRPPAIVLDMDGLLPLDEMGVLMLPTVAREAAAEGTPVLLANPSRPLHDRLIQLGVRDLTIVDRRAPTPAEDEGGQADSTDGALPSSPCPFCGALRRDDVPLPDGARDPAAVAAARHPADDAHRARSRPPRRPTRRDRPSPAAVAAGSTQDLEPSVELLRPARTAGDARGRPHPPREEQGSHQGPADRRTSRNAPAGDAANRRGRDDEHES